MTRFGIIISLLFVTMAAAEEKAIKDKWVSIFNGKDLKGWKVNCLKKDKEKEFWKVADGTIECDSIGRKNHDYVWLTTEKGIRRFRTEIKIPGLP